MREILFRGKRTDNGEWVEGNLIRYIDGQSAILEIGGLRIFSVIPATVGQYTGLNDKNVVRIFEGDVCKGNNILHPSRTIYQVSYEDVMFGFYDCNGTLWHFSHIDDSHIDDVEVIGNIHDNPELMEGE